MCIFIEKGRGRELNSPQRHFNMNILKKILEFFERYKAISFILMLIVLGTMWHFSSLPGGTIAVGSIWPSIIYHFSIFALFAFFLLMIITKDRIKLREILIVIFISLIFSLLDEIHQSFVPLRTPSIGDILTDLAGISSASVLCYLIKKD